MATPSAPTIAEQLPELRAANLPHLRWQDVLKPSDGAEPPSEVDQVTLDAYFHRYIPWQMNDAGKSVCVCCRKIVHGGNSISSFLLGGSPDSTTMQWGIQHGVCFCRECGWPARAYHYDIGGEADPLIKRLNLTLQFHPDELQAEASPLSASEGEPTT